MDIASKRLTRLFSKRYCEVNENSLQTGFWETKGPRRCGYSGNAPVKPHSMTALVFCSSIFASAGRLGATDDEAKAAPKARPEPQILSVFPLGVARACRVRFADGAWRTLTLSGLIARRLQRK
jgi:hypothetical protein